MNNYHSHSFLTQQVRRLIDFYYPRSIDTKYGGYINQWNPDGNCYDTDTRHLVGTCRSIVNFANAYLLLGEEKYKEAARHGVDFLRKHHRNPENGGYFWVLHAKNGVEDDTYHCYGHAFVVLAYAMAVKTGITEANAYLEETYRLMEAHFWEPHAKLYADEITSNWKTVQPYRGQNANMHACEAMLMAFEATNDPLYLERAYTLAKQVTTVINRDAGGMVWEHYDTNWSIIWDYNSDNPKHTFRPPGYNLGHLTEWSKLLLILERHQKEEWMLPTARFLFDTTLEQGWDTANGGIVYTLSPEGKVLDGDKYSWVHVETIAAAALLETRTGLAEYGEWYHRLWLWSEAAFCHPSGLWRRIVGHDNREIEPTRSQPYNNDYHPVGACVEILRTLT